MSPALEGIKRREGGPMVVPNSSGKFGQRQCLYPGASCDPFPLETACPPSRVLALS
ncbi:MAG: hypothetical protein ACJASY_001914 [Halioglobus sp.]|jgi:hypothetical protein